jgi:hypothetical protein
MNQFNPESLTFKDGAKTEFMPSALKAGYSTPTLISGFGALYYLCDRPPTSIEPDCYTDLSDFSYWWVDQIGDQLYWCVDNTSNAMIWLTIANQTNILSMLDGQGWEVNTSRAYVPTASPAFSTVYTPSATNDTTVVAVVLIDNSSLTSPNISAQVNSGGGYTTIAAAAMSGAGIAGTSTQTLTFTVPAGASYQLIDTNAGPTDAIISINQLSQ